MAKRRVQAFTPPPSFGSYEVDKPLGRGGMATVYRGVHTLLQRPVAIKFLHQNVAASASARERFVREARLVAKLAHPNVVTVFDFGQLDDGTYYTASELIAGDTLKTFLARRGALLETVALRFTRQLAAGLRSAHDVGVIHRDLKPSNIMLLADPDDVDGFRLKVLDFGIAKSLETSDESNPDLTKAGVVIGTPGYMSPEQCLGSPRIGPTSDIYSLGVVLFAMVTAQLPFASDNTDDLLDQHTHDRAPKPSETGAHVSPAVDDLVSRCLAKLPEHRPQTMRDLIELIDTTLVSIGAAPAYRASGAVMSLATGSMTGPVPDLGPNTVRLGQVERAVRIAAVAEGTEVETTVSFGEVVATPMPPPIAARRRRPVWIGLAAATVGAVLAIVLIASLAGGTRKPSAGPDPIATESPVAGPPSSVSIDAGATVVPGPPASPSLSPIAHDTPPMPSTPSPPHKKQPPPRKPSPGKPAARPTAAGSGDDGFRY